MLMFIPLAQSIVAMTNIEVKKELLETMASQDAIGVVQVASDLTHRDLLAPPQWKPSRKQWRPWPNMLLVTQLQRPGDVGLCVVLETLIWITNLKKNPKP